MYRVQQLYRNKYSYADLAHSPPHLATTPLLSSIDMPPLEERQRGVVVAEEGNKRTGEMMPAEIRQCVADLVGWFEKRNKSATSGAGATDSQLKKLTLPLAMEELYLQTNGNLIWFDDKKMVSLREAERLKVEMKEHNPKDDHYFPFGNDDEDDLLVVDCETEAVYEYEIYDGLGHKITDSFSDYLERYRNDILADHYEFIEEMGVIEKVGNSRPPRGK